MMDKGKGKKGTSWPREVGTRPYLKNFRKGLRHQRERCVRELEAARDDATARDAEDRWRWILEKSRNWLTMARKWSGTCQSSGAAGRWSMETWSPPLGVV